MLYSTFSNKFIVKGTIVAVDPIHIGAASSDSLNPIEVDNAVLKDSNGNPVIPGSSLKGVVRSQFESVLKLMGRTVCDIHNDRDEKCISKAKADTIKKKNISRKEQAEELYNGSCEVCRLFGGRYFAGKLHFKDCSYAGDAPCQFEKRDGVGIDRETGAAKKNAKYDYEIIPKGTCFDFEIIAENLDAEQESYLDFIIRLLCGEGISDGDYLAIGGKTTRGLGRIALNGFTKEKITPDELKNRVEQLMKSRIACEGE
jgi:CRISPR-associated RAMP protein (TIGR02581 family)